MPRHMKQYQMCSPNPDQVRACACRYLSAMVLMAASAKGVGGISGEVGQLQLLLLQTSGQHLLRSMETWEPVVSCGGCTWLRHDCQWYSSDECSCFITSPCWHGQQEAALIALLLLVEAAMHIAAGLCLIVLSLHVLQPDSMTISHQPTCGYSIMQAVHESSACSLLICGVCMQEVMWGP